MADASEVSAFSVYKRTQPASSKSDTLKLKNKMRRKLAKERKREQQHKPDLSVAMKPKKKIKPSLNEDLVHSSLSLTRLRTVPKDIKTNKNKQNAEILPKTRSKSSVPKLISCETLAKKKLNGIPNDRPTSTRNIPDSTSITDSDVDSSTDDGSESIVVTDSVEEGKKLFAWLISPTNVDTFLANTWEQKPLHISRKNPNYYKNIISTPILDKILRTENIMFTKNIDITSYTNNKRETFNPVGRALPHIVWDYYLNGCSVRFLNPQTYIPRLHLLNATLQEYFNCFVGANSYLTPPNSQGFAPHYDDIEAFVIQIEGKKRWKVYSPRSEEEVLPRFSSVNFEQSEIGKPLLEVVLEPGDMLYFPRGYIHQGVTVDGEHSLHITISCYQKNSWADLFEKMLPQALESAIKEDVDFRKGLPIDIFNNLGLVHSDSKTPRRGEILKQLKKLFLKIADHLPCDDAVDQVSKNFIHAALPPVITEQEKSLTVYGDSDQMMKKGQVINRVEMQLDTRIRLLRANIIRIVMEDQAIRIYYYVENSKEYHGNEAQYLEINEGLALAVENLITTYPEYISVENLELTDDSDKLQIAGDLWEKGIIITEEPLNYID